MKKVNPDISPLQEALVACRSMLGYILLFGFMCNFLSLSTSIYSMQVLDKVLSSQNMDTLLMLTIAIILALVVLSLIQGARGFATNRLGMWFEYTLSPAIFRNACRVAVDRRLGGGSQQLRDLQTIKNYLISPSVLIMLDIPWSIIFIVVAFLLHPYIGWLSIVGGTIIISVGIISDRLTTPLMSSSNDEFVQSMQYVDQSTRNTEAIEAMGLFPNIFKSWQKINKNVQDVQQLVTYRQVFFNELSTFIRTVVQISVTCLGAYLVVHNELSSGAMIASSTIVGKALQPFQTAIGAWKNFVGARKAYGRIQAAFISGVAQEESKMSLPEPKGLLAIEKISYEVKVEGLNIKRNILEDISCEIKPGEFTVIMGASGSGKTTFAKILVGALVPTDGIVRIDGANIADWNKYELGVHIGYLGQDVGLFDGTIRENIARMDSDADPEDVIKAARAANVHEMILQLPNSYDTKIGAGGIILSGGQRQRVGLARAFYKEPNILILDEPNANLDIAGDEALQNALLAIKNRSSTTIIVISHKPNICNIADNIMLMDRGKVVRYCPADEFMQMLKKAQ